MHCATVPQSRAVRGQLYLQLVVALVVCVAGCALSDAQSARDKGGRMAKLSQELTALYSEYSAYLASRKGGKFQSSQPLVWVIDDRVVVDATASGDANALKSDLEELGMQQAVAYGRIVSGQLPIAALPRLEGVPSLNFARAAAALLHSDPRALSPGTPGR